MRYKDRAHADLKFFIIIIIFSIISILTIKSAEIVLSTSGLVLKQIIWYIAGFIFIFLIMKIKNNFFYRNIYYIYIIGNIALLLLLIFGEPINDAKCWFNFYDIITIQPSEFMKIILIILLAKEIDTFNSNHKNTSVKDEFYFLIRIMFFVLIPSILTFLEPDTGVVLIYLLITVVMLFTSGIRLGWFALLFGILFFMIALVLGTYFISNDLFIKIFGTSFFLRVDRLLDWSSGSGYQLNNGIISIGSAGFLGNGYLNTPTYFPEAQTDFIFAVYASNFGFLGSIILISLLAYFDIQIILLALKADNNLNKYILSGIIGMLIYQQFQNIGMTYGIMPITGITLPFISYGGSSLISYMIIAGIIINISIENKKYKNKY
jgi:rod shape determining protein RodA